MNKATCGADGCTRQAGHEMPHGLDCGWMIVAPWSDAERKRLPNPDDGPIPCNVCGIPLELDSERTRASCSCGQQITFADDGSYGQAVLPRLYPSKMGPKMKREAADHELTQRAFFDTLRVRFGLIDQEEYEQRRERDITAKAKYLALEVAPLERRWWRRMFA